MNSNLITSEAPLNAPAFLSPAAVRELAPAAFATAPHSRVSSSYRFVPTTEVTKGFPLMSKTREQLLRERRDELEALLTEFNLETERLETTDQLTEATQLSIRITGALVALKSLLS